MGWYRIPPDLKLKISSGVQPGSQQVTGIEALALPRRDETRRCSAADQLVATFTNERAREVDIVFVLTLVDVEERRVLHVPVIVVAVGIGLRS